MKQYFREGDLLAAEVEKVSDTTGGIQLRVRSKVCGKLENGFLVKINHENVRRMSS